MRSRKSRRRPFAFDLASFTLVPTSVKHLEEIVFNRIPLAVRPAMVVGILGRTLQGLEGFFEARNALVEEFRAIQTKSETGLDPRMYFGGVSIGRVADERYSSVLRNMDLFTDDAIYFSKMVGDDLRRQAKALRDALPNRANRSSPSLSRLTFQSGRT